MISSMTGYAECKFDFAWGAIIWKLRSLNHRGIEINLRTPEEMRNLETAFRRSISSRIERGRVDATLFIARLDDKSVGRLPDRQRIRQLMAQSDAVRTIMHDARQLSVMEVLSWPDVVPAADLAADEISAQITDALEDALEQLIANRQNEGSGIHEYLVLKSAELRQMLEAAREMIPAAEAAFTDRMNDAVEKMSHEIDPARMEQEIAILLMKADVAEELSRLEMHLNEVDRVLKEEAIAGKRLGFLTQELQREANTVASKTAHHPLNALMVSVKLVIDQVREQALNVE